MSPYARIFAKDEKNAAIEKKAASLEVLLTGEETGSDALQHDGRLVPFLNLMPGVPGSDEINAAGKDALLPN